MDTEIPALLLKKNQDKRLRTGHCWIYSNEIDTEKTPLKGLQPGEQVAVVDDRELFIGFGYVNPHSLIAVRLMSRDQTHPISESLIVHRLNIALALRQRFYAQPYYRAVFGESDGLPGLIVDRYGDYLVLQLSTAGMEALRPAVLAAVDKVFKPKAILLRNDSSVRELEGLDRGVELAAGQMPERLELSEGGCRFRISPHDGQKTGWFFDQAANRDRLLPLVKERRVLDLFSYVGGWGVRCAAAGAEAVTCVDSSESALELVRENAAINGVEKTVDSLRGDAFEVVRQLKEANQRFDIVLVDPPAFIKRRKDQKQGELAYRRINQAAMQLLSRDGLLVSSSCSHHLGGDGLLSLINQAGRHLDRSLQLLMSGSQGPDHPIHPAIPETSYLKSFTLRVLPRF
ncbi:MAG: class I SAM-dependent rRNA methyltransferase [Gammaproteobacteria bacterium]|nr:class I SAM-dependent rRNA methyltransferase [Gammaproteobacteria bacterium]